MQDKTCLVIIDLQAQFRYEGFDNLVANVIRLVDFGWYDHVVSFKLCNDEDAPFYKLSGWEGCMDEDSRKIPESLVVRSERVFEKRTSSCCTSEFLEFLKENGITRCDLCGIDTHNCVLSSAFALFDLGIKVGLLSTCSSSRHHNDLHESAVAIFDHAFGPCSV